MTPCLPRGLNHRGLGGMRPWDPLRQSKAPWAPHFHSTLLVSLNLLRASRRSEGADSTRTPFRPLPLRQSPPQQRSLLSRVRRGSGGQRVRDQASGQRCFGHWTSGGSRPTTGSSSRESGSVLVASCCHIAPPLQAKHVRRTPSLLSSSAGLRRMAWCLGG
jgi:hypothetical protein